MIEKAMILAAGLGTRMRPLSDTVPKPLVTVDGRALIDYQFDALRRAGVKKAVVNVHYLAEQMEAHLRDVEGLEIIISDEREGLLDSGGGIHKALHHFNNEAFFVLNSDTFWVGDEPPSLLQLSRHWRGEDMDILLALTKLESAVGFDGRGDFFADKSGHLTRRGDKSAAPFVFTSDYILHPRIFSDVPSRPFSSNLLFDRAIAAKRLIGVGLEGLWLHVGTPQSIHDTERAIALHRASGQ